MSAVDLQHLRHEHDLDVPSSLTAEEVARLHAESHEAEWWAHRHGENAAPSVEQARRS